MKRIVTLVIWGIAQIILFFFLFFVPAYNASFLYTLLVFIGILLALGILSDDSKLTTSKLSWITIVLAIPVFGVLLYIIFGQGHMSNYRKKILENSRLLYKNDNKYDVDISSLSSQKKSLIAYLDNMKFKISNLHYGGDIECYTNGNDKYKQLFIDIENATTYIHIEYYIVKLGKLYDELVELLVKKAQQGVEVRMISDYVGGRTLSDNRIKYLRDNNIKFTFFNELKFTVLSKLSNFRDHRKIVVIDGKIAYTGGFNIGDEYIDLDKYYQHWQDFHVRISNSSAVLDYENFFAQIWYYETRENLFVHQYYPEYDIENINTDTLIYPYIDGPDTVETFIRDMFAKSIMLANKSIYIATPYLIPDSVVFDALIIQANSGININIVTPGLPDKKYVKLATESYYNDLIKAGIRIFEYDGFIHSKKVLVDDEFAIVGTANFDMRSFNLSFEVCTLLINGQIIKDIKMTFDDEIENSKEVTIKDMGKYPLLKRASQVILRLFAPLF